MEFSPCNIYKEGFSKFFPSQVFSHWTYKPGEHNSTKKGFSKFSPYKCSAPGHINLVNTIHTSSTCNFFLSKVFTWTPFNVFSIQIMVFKTLFFIFMTFAFLLKVFSQSHEREGEVYRCRFRHPVFN